MFSLLKHEERKISLRLYKIIQAFIRALENPNNHDEKLPYLGCIDGEGKTIMDLAVE
jgi:hypothetical protein